jgi:hypothetical protein
LICPRTYRYRYSFLHIFPVVLVAAIVYFAGERIGFYLRQPTLLIGASLFLFFLAWPQLTAWNEKIILDETGIRWVDYLGRTRVEARLDEIVNLTTTSGTNGGCPSLTISTNQGEVKANFYLWGFTNLRRQIEELLNARKQRDGFQSSTTLGKSGEMRATTS